MTETAKLLNLRKTVPIPDLDAGCLLADSIDPGDVRLLRQRYLGVPVVPYANTSAAVKAESDVCCTSGSGRAVLESLDVERVIMLPDENTAAETEVEIIAWSGHCEVHERFTSADILQLREDHSGVKVLAHPECPQDVVAVLDFSGSIAAMSNYVGTRKPARVILLTECTMSDTVAVTASEIAFIRPCNLHRHMKRINLASIRRSPAEDQHVVIIDPAIAKRARLAVERMLAL